MPQKRTMSCMTNCYNMIVFMTKHHFWIGPVLVLYNDQRSVCRIFFFVKIDILLDEEINLVKHYNPIVFLAMVYHLPSWY